MSDDIELDKLLSLVKGYKMSPEEIEEQRISFAYGNVALHNPNITEEDVRRVAHKMGFSYEGKLTPLIGTDSGIKSGSFYFVYYESKKCKKEMFIIKGENLKNKILKECNNCYGEIIELLDKD